MMGVNIPRSSSSSSSTSSSSDIVKKKETKVETLPQFAHPSEPISVIIIRHCQEKRKQKSGSIAHNLPMRVNLLLHHHLLLLLLLHLHLHQHQQTIVKKKRTEVDSVSCVLVVKSLPQFAHVSGYEPLNTFITTTTTTTIIILTIILIIIIIIIIIIITTITTTTTITTIIIIIRCRTEHGEIPMDSSEGASKDCDASM
jgi:hypothetical protein